MMTVFRNDNRWDRSNVEFVSGEIRCYSKRRSTPSMSHIDYGLGVLRARAIENRAAGEAFDLADVFADLVARGELAGYEADRRFYEVGSPEGLRATERYLASARP
jgi:NDP-sugar pyrophosphorylase family protein